MDSLIRGFIGALVTLSLLAVSPLAQVRKVPPASGGAAWGSITGTLADQTDLQAALDAVTFDQDLNTDDDVVFESLVLSGSSAQLSGTAGFTFSIITPDSATEARSIQILPGNATADNTGGHLDFEAGDSVSGAGGNVDLFAGNGVQGGAIEIEAGDGTTSDGGDIDLDAGESLGGGNGGSVFVRSGAGATAGKVQINSAGVIELFSVGNINLFPDSADLLINGTPGVTNAAGCAAHTKGICTTSASPDDSPAALRREIAELRNLIASLQPTRPRQ